MRWWREACFVGLTVLLASPSLSQAPEPAKQNAARMLASAASSARTPVAQASGTSGNLCVSYTYDANGNRLTQVSGALNTTATWGSATFPCFTWRAP